MLYKGGDGPSLPEPSLYPTFWINHASRALMRRFEERLRPLGFGAAYLPVLFALEEKPRPQKELLARISVSQPTLAALLTRMERDGVLTRETNPEDRREQIFSLTPSARAALPSVAQALLESVDEALSGISLEDQERLMALLKTVVKNLDPDSSDSSAKTMRTPNQDSC